MYPKCGGSHETPRWHRSRPRTISTTLTVRRMGCVLTTDVLDEFEQKPAAAAEPEPAAQTAPADGSTEDPLSDEFVQELTKNMESFMKQLEQHMPASSEPPAADSRACAGDGDAIAENELMKQFERMLATNPDTGANGGRSEAAAAKEAPTTSASKEGENFQDAIRATMDKLKQSSENASQAKDAGNPLSALGLDGDADLGKMLEALGGEAGASGEMPDLTKMLTQMMEDLMNKDVLYEPLKEMHAKVR